ncbi:hypothetical protein ACFL4T_09210 [candidate division KSB1 bacterium]
MMDFEKSSTKEICTSERRLMKYKAKGLSPAVWFGGVTDKNLTRFPREQALLESLELRLK